MLDIGQKAPEFRGDGSTIKGVVEGLKHNKLCVISGVYDSYLDITAANTYERLDIVPYKTWRVIGFGMYWLAGSTANEDPIIEFGYNSDNNAFGTMTSEITGGERLASGDHQKYDPTGILAPEIIAEASATLVITWTEGVAFNVWQTSLRDLRAVEAAVAGMSSGYVLHYMLIEVDTGGKW